MAEPIFLHDGYARYKVVQWLPVSERYWNVCAIVATAEGLILYREAPWFLCTRGEDGGCRWCRPAATLVGQV